jgi:hypothetical protein
MANGLKNMEYGKANIKISYKEKLRKRKTPLESLQIPQNIKYEYNLRINYASVIEKGFQNLSIF